MLNFDQYHQYKGILSKMNESSSGDFLGDSEKVKEIKTLARKTVDRVIGRMVLSTKLKFFTTWIYNARILWDPPPYRKPDGSIGFMNTMATDGTNIFISSPFVTGLVDVFGEEVDTIIKFILCHEVLHMALMHAQRLKGRDHEKWNIAGDFEINDILMTDGFVTEEQIKKAKGLIDQKYHGLGAEEIYNMDPSADMPQPPQPQQKPLTVEVGDYIRVKKTGVFGKIKKINPNGTFEYDSVTEAEAIAALPAQGARKMAGL